MTRKKSPKKRKRSVLTRSTRVRSEGDDAPAEGRGVFDGEPPLDFPPGFPIVDGEVLEADTTPAADADQIAMLNRMMGMGGGD